MTRPQDDVGETKSRSDLPLQSQVTDPFTGRTAAGPLESSDQRPPSGGWSTAARWLALALALIAFAIVVYWMSR